MAEQHVPAATTEEQADVAQATIERLEAQLRRIPKSRSFEQGVVRYQLGLAYQELPIGDRAINLSRAVASLQKATRFFDAVQTPIEHARSQNALGAALREIGQMEEAAGAFSTAARLLPVQINPGEYGAATNNLGLTLTDLGRIDEAVAAYEQSLAAFAAPEFVRQRIAALHNIGQALAARNDAANVAAAVERYEAALELADPEEHPYQWALINHSIGVAYTAIEEPGRAVAAFKESLRVFTRPRFPFQYALAKNNLGLANAQLGDLASLRRAVAAFEDSLRVLDVRLQREQWEQVYRNLELAENALKEIGEGATRAEHFMRMAAEEDDDTLVALMRDRLLEFTVLPDPRRVDALAELDRATLGLNEDAARRLTRVWLDVLMELPQEQFEAGLRARMAVHESLPAEQQERAVAVLDHAIQGGLLAPQRIRVRDTLAGLGYERPDA